VESTEEGKWKKSFSITAERKVPALLGSFSHQPDLWPMGNRRSPE